MSKFKPCPFCGCSAPPAVQGNGIGDNWLECTECGASTRLREDGAGSEKDWNRRAARATAQQSEPVEPRPKMAIHRSFDTMCWPTPCPDLNEVSWRLTHGFSDQIDRLIGSSVIAAYVHLISMPAMQRNQIITEVRKGPNTGAAIESQRSGDGS